MTTTVRRPPQRAAARRPIGRQARRGRRRHARDRRRERSFVLVDIAAPAYLVLHLWLTFDPSALLLIIPSIFLSTGMPAIALVILLLTPTERLGRIPVLWALVAFAGWLILSWSWSELPRVSFDLIRLELIPLLVLSLVVGTIPPRVVVRTLLGLVVVVCTWSLLVSLALPMSRAAVQGAGPDGVQPGFRGTFGHKNLLGIFAVYALCLVLPFLRGRGRIPMVLLCVLLVISTRSATAASGLMAVVFAWFWIAAIDVQKSQRERQFLVAASLMSAGAGILMAFGLMPALLGLYQKDLTFSGRTFIWAESLVSVQRQPIQGYGFGGVWWDGRSPVTADLHRRIGFGASHAHNGAIELLIEVGIIGLGLFIVFLGRTLRLAVGAFGRAGRSAYGQWGILVILSLVLMSVSEPLFRTPSLGLLTVIAVVLTMLRNTDARPPEVRSPATTF